MEEWRSGGVEEWSRTERVRRSTCDTRLDFHTLLTHCHTSLTLTLSSRRSALQLSPAVTPPSVHVLLLSTVTSSHQPPESPLTSTSSHICIIVVHVCNQRSHTCTCTPLAPALLSVASLSTTVVCASPFNMHCLPLACLLLALTLSTLTLATVPPSSPRPLSTHTSTPPLASLLPAISSALRDLSAVDVDDASYLTLAKRNLRFLLSGMVSPLQLLDWSHWSTDPFASVIHSHSHAADGEWQADEDDFALHGDLSHVLRTTVNAHKRAATPHTPHRSYPTSQPPPILSPPRPPPPAALYTLSTPAPTHTADNANADHFFDTIDSTGADVNDIAAPSAICGNHGVPVRFTLYKNGTFEEATLCYCPFDYTAATCGVRQSYRCRLHLITDVTSACTSARATPVPTLYSSHSERLSPVHLSSSPSDFYTYEPVLSGPVAPCLSISDEQSVLAVNFTCHFVDYKGEETFGVEGFDRARLAYRLSLGYVLNDTLPVLRYTVKNVDSKTGGVTFASSGAVQVSISARLHNTAHPSQYLQTVYPLTTAHVQFDAANHNRTVPLTVLANVTAIEPNLKRGGRLLLALRWHDMTAGLVTAGSGLPWQLTIEDGTWQLPAPTERWWALTAWQTTVLLVAVVVVVLLLVWRWWQQRQTARMQELLAEQRGKQQSWYVASH